MNIEELEEALDELFPNGFSIEYDNHGQVVIYTGLKKQDDDDGDGDLIPIDVEEDEDLDPDVDSLEDDDIDDEE